MITDRELKNIETMTTDNGCLRSLMMVAQRVAQFTDNPDITKAIQTLLNGHPVFAVWNECHGRRGGSVGEESAEY